MQPIGTEALPLFQQETMACSAGEDAKRQARSRVTAQHADRIARLIPLAQELAAKAGPHGLTVGDIRLAGEQRGLLERGQGRALSWLTGLPKAAGLISTGRRRTSPLTRSRNDHVIWISAEFAGKGAAA